jgi:hypothetical protein
MCYTTINTLCYQSVVLMLGYLYMLMIVPDYVMDPGKVDGNFCNQSPAIHIIENIITEIIIYCKI